MGKLGFPGFPSSMPVFGSTCTGAEPADRVCFCRSPVKYGAFGDVQRCETSVCKGICDCVDTVIGAKSAIFGSVFSVAKIE